MAICNDKSKSDGMVWKCPLRNCCGRQKKTIRIGSFFEGLKAKLDEILLAMYFFLNESSQKEIISFTRLNPKTIRSVTRQCYRLIEADLTIEDMRVGMILRVLCMVTHYICMLIISLGGVNEDGTPIAVEVDESLFGKIKSARGHSVKGVWIVGGVERTPERKIFMATVPYRNTDTLHTLLKTYIKPGSQINTDKWRAYNRIDRACDDNGNPLGYTYKKVDHSKEFKAADGTHTNTIEGIHLNACFCFAFINQSKHRHMGWHHACGLRSSSNSIYNAMAPY